MANYQTNDTETQIEIQFEQGTFRLMQRPASKKHNGNIFLVSCHPAGIEDVVSFRGISKPLKRLG
jgi:hypothetical protein